MDAVIGIFPASEKVSSIIDTGILGKDNLTALVIDSSADRYTFIDAALSSYADNYFNGMAIQLFVPSLIEFTNRYDKYSGLSSQIQGQVDQQLEAFKMGIKITKGLGQSRYTYGRGAAYGPWVSGTANVRAWVGSFRSGFTPRPGFFQ